MLVFFYENDRLENIKSHENIVRCMNPHSFIHSFILFFFFLYSTCQNQTRISVEQRWQWSRKSKLLWLVSEIKYRISNQSESFSHRRWLYWKGKRGRNQYRLDIHISFRQHYVSFIKMENILKILMYQRYSKIMQVRWEEYV